MFSHQLTVDLSAPNQSLSQLSFCRTNPQGLEHWLAGLRMANIGKAAQDLYLGLQELNQVRMSSKLRLQMLEAIRPKVHLISRALAKHYIDQSLYLTDKQIKVIHLSQSLHNRLATGYKMILLQGAANGDLMKQPKLAGKPIHRIICELSINMLRAYQIYYPVPQNAWYELHQLYLLAEELGVQRHAVQDSISCRNQVATIENVYKRILLMDATLPNKLRCKEISLLFYICENWAAYAHLLDLEMDAIQFSFPLQEDIGPTPANLVDEPISLQRRGLDLSVILSSLRNWSVKDSPQPNEIPMPEALSRPLVAHLLRVWGESRERNHRRSKAQGQIRICLGLSALHFHLNGGRELQPPESSPKVVNTQETERGEDIWSQALDAFDDHLGKDPRFIDTDNYPNYVKDSSQQRKRYPSYDIQLVNISAAGYGLCWYGAPPAVFQSGELIGVQETRFNPWFVGRIAWVRRLNRHELYLGVQLLGPNAIPCAAKPMQKIGRDQQYLPALFIPPVQFAEAQAPQALPVDQSATLLLPRLPFKAGQRVLLNYAGKESRFQLRRCVAASQNFAQFETQTMPGIHRPAQTRSQPASDKQAEDSDGDDFSSLWHRL